MYHYPYGVRIVMNFEVASKWDKMGSRALEGAISTPRGPPWNRPGEDNRRGKETNNDTTRLLTPRGRRILEEEEHLPPRISGALNPLLDSQHILNISSISPHIFCIYLSVWVPYANLAIITPDCLISPDWKAQSGSKQAQG